MAEILELEKLRAYRETNRQKTERRIAKRDELYWNFRYRKDSYKAKRMGLQPILIMAKRGKDMIRVYGEVGRDISPAKFAFATTRFKAWGQKEQELKRLRLPAYRQWLKDNHLKATNNPFSYWLINIAP